MLQKIKGFFKGRRRDRTRREELLEERRAAEHFRDLIGVGRQLEFPVIVTIWVNGVEAGVTLRGRKDKTLRDLYDFAAGEALRLSAEE